jgi:hypothetical protein
MAAGRRLSDEEVQALRDEARGLPKDVSFRPFCEEHARLLGCHPTTIYRAIKPVLPRKRKRRADKGASRTLDEEIFLDLASLVTRFDYDAELAIDTVNANRVRDGRPAIELHPETLRRQLREAGVSRRLNARDLRVHRRWEAERPNELWQIDSTVSAHYYIDTDDTIGYEAPVQLNKTKAGNGLPRVWLIGIVDDHSRVQWGRFYTANSALAWRDLIIRAGRKGAFGDELEWPAYGIPEAIYSDQDSAMKSGVMTRTLDLLGIERKLAKPSTPHETNAQAKGKTERGLGLILQGFEKTARGQRFASLERMNEALRHHLIWKNNRIHSETGVVPFERFLQATELVMLPPREILRRVLYKEVERTIRSDVSIKLEGKTYQLPRRAPFVDHIDRKVQVLYFEADLSKITVVLDGEEHEIEAVEAQPDTAGDYHQAETPASVRLKRELLKRDLSHIDTHAVHEYRTQRDRRIYAVGRPEIEHPITEQAFAPVLVRRGKAVDRAQRAGVIATPPTDSERAALTALFGDRKEIPEDELKQWIESRRGGTGDTRTARAEGA